MGVRAPGKESYQNLLKNNLLSERARVVPETAMVDEVHCFSDFVPESIGVLANDLTKARWRLGERMRQWILFWGSLFRTAVILTSGTSVLGVVHHAPCLGSAGSGRSGSSPAVPNFFSL